MTERASNTIRETLERITGALPIINSDHSAIHKGEGFKTYFDLGEVTGTDQFLIKTPEEKYVHFKNLEMKALGGTVKATIKRGAVATNDGTASDDVEGPHQMNDNSAFESGMTITEGPTLSDIGEDWIIIKVVGESTNQYTSVAETQQNPNEELILKPDTYYLLEVEKIGEDTPSNVLLTAFWYEEMDG